jgi:cyclophilin family peptidyl-prolyl cis-trans isomerase
MQRISLLIAFTLALGVVHAGETYKVTLEESDRKEAEALVAQLGSTDFQTRTKAEAQLIEYGPALRPFVEPLLKSGNTTLVAAAQRLLADPALSIELTRVRLTLDHGTVEMVLYEDAAPNTVANFVTLAERGFYDNLRFHKVVEQFMALTGDPTNTGKGGPGYHIADEIDADALGLDKLTAGELTKRSKQPAPPAEVANLPVKEVYKRQGYAFTQGLKSMPMKRGTVAMFGSRPNSAGSQFFIATVDCPWLDGRHTVFGQVVKGLGLIDALRINDRVVKVEVLFKRLPAYAVKKIEDK